MSDFTKLDMHTPDLTQENIKNIATLFPNVVTETIGEDGKPRQAIDFDLLRQQLSDEIVEGGEERYRLDRPGKRKSLLKANTPITKTLRPVPEDSVNWESTENLYIEGDNFEVLKILQESYLGQVKMIYIDPPYNTGKDFVYKDDFKKGKADYESELDLEDEEGGKLVKNTDTNGRFHSDWLSMMYERLIVARDLLKDDGVIFMSIDDNEVYNLKKVSDQVFGLNNFLGNIIWETATDNNASQVSVEHEYILVYAKNIDVQSERKIKSEKGKIIEEKYHEIKKQYSDIKIIQKHLKRRISSIKKSNEIDLSGVSHYSYVDEKGVYYPGNPNNTSKGDYNYDIIHPITKKSCQKPSNGWRRPETTFWNADSIGDVEWGEDETVIPKIKKRLETASELLKSYHYEDNRVSTNKLKNLLGDKVFDNPKSVNLLLKLIKFTTSENDIILDFFSGSGSLGEAILLSNFEQQQNRRFLLVQLREDLDESLISASKKAKVTINNAIKFLDKIAKPHFITEIGKERIRRAGQKILEDNTDKLAERETPLDIGFRVYRVDSTNMKDVYYHPSEVDQKNLGMFATNIKEDRTPEDLLTQVMLDLALPLSLSLETKTLSGNKVFFVGHNALVACFDDQIDFSIIDKMAEVQPLKVVFRDSCFKDDKDKINVDNRFKRLSPETVVSVI